MASLLFFLNQHVRFNIGPNVPLAGLKHGMDFPSTYHIQRTRLHDAVINGFDREVRQLLSDPDCYIHARYGSKTALQYALDQQSTRIIDVLLSHGARLSADDLAYYELSDLAWASRQWWHGEICDALKSKGPSPTAVTEEVESLLDRIRLLPVGPDITNSLIDLTECWSLSTTIKRKEARVHQRTAPTPYIVSAPITGRDHQPVRRIMFKIVSHDQGWGGEGCPDLYGQSWTWFEVTSSSNPKPVEVQRNVSVSEIWRTHVIIWDMHSSPHIVEWLDSLKSGDVVSLYAKALYPGWENSVSCAEIRIYTSCV